MSEARSLFTRRRILLSRLVIWPLGALLLATGSGWETRPPWGGLLYLAGCLLVGVATIGRLWCSLYICGRKTRELVTSGPYSMSRNPLYFFSAIGAVGVGLGTETFTVPAVLLLLFAVAYPVVIRDEERKLRALHGDVFDAYVVRTPRFFPRLSARSEPESYTVNPRGFRNALFDALWFVWLIGLLELAESAREAGLVPSLLTLY